jgi:hypothetical protein
VFFMLGLT